MTLRIPDDEVARPTGESAAPPPVRALSRPAPASPEPPLVALTPMRIISIDSDLPPAPDEFDPVLTTRRRSPTGLRRGRPAASGRRRRSRSKTATTSRSSLTSRSTVRSASRSRRTAADSSEQPTEPVLPAAPSTPRVLASGAEEIEEVAPITEETLVDLAAVADETGEDLAAVADETGEDLAAVAEATSEDLAPVAEEPAEELGVSGGDEDVRFEDDALTPALPRVALSPSPETERRSDPGDAPEISAEDMVAVEAAPSPLRAPVDLPPMRARAPSHQSHVPHLPQSQLPLPPTAVVRPIPVPPIRPPLVIVPPHVGNMAPQTSDSIGPRRKGRLWWEDLFNDDYLRTMEKITDAQIGKEVDFIETSLGLERGGTMLDLACGTGPPGDRARAARLRGRRLRPLAADARSRRRRGAGAGRQAQLRAGRHARHDLRGAVRRRVLLEHGVRVLRRGEERARRRSRPPRAQGRAASSCSTSSTATSSCASRRRSPGSRATAASAWTR